MEPLQATKDVIGSIDSGPVLAQRSADSPGPTTHSPLTDHSGFQVRVASAGESEFSRIDKCCRSE